MNLKDLKHYGTFALTESGPKFVPDDPAFFRLNAEGLVGKRVEIDMRETRRSNTANAYYWAGVIKVFVDFFNKERTFNRTVDGEFVHDVLKAKVLGYKKQTLPDGEVIEIPGSSSRLTVGEFANFIEEAKAWGGELFSLSFPDKPVTSL